ncbi:Gluconokinase [Vitis vinifera]|uniref:gluconokinase n=1 Tax=Vitis vinifera TaxID=29760 RepID=A0A438IYJ7_VITVI|nr:Gluconokinase [Vitis vinifera]
MMSLSLKGRFLFTFFIVQYDPIWGGSIQAIIFDYVPSLSWINISSFPSLISFQIGFSITSASMDAMDSNLKGQFSHPFFHFPRMAVVIMGVCGSGKSTIGNMLAKVLNCSFLDADDFHPESNKDEERDCSIRQDRIPWLETLRNALREHLLSNNTVVLGCSALQKNYREILRSADPNYEHGSFESMVKFVLLDARAELDPSEGILKVDATQSPDDTVNGIQALIF